MMLYMIIYPCGDRTMLDIGDVRDYEKDDWALASRREFPYTDEGKQEAIAYCKELAARHGLKVRISGEHDYLD